MNNKIKIKIYFNLLNININKLNKGNMQVTFWCNVQYKINNYINIIFTTKLSMTNK